MHLKITVRSSLIFGKWYVLTFGKNSIQSEAVMQKSRKTDTRAKVTPMDDAVRNDNGTATTQQMTVL